MIKRFKLLPFLLGSLFFLASCGGENKSNEGNNDEGTSLSDVVKGVSNLDNLGDAAKTMEDLQSKLKTETPVSAAVLKEFLPETFEGLKRTSYSSGNLTSAEAVYTVNDQKDLKISVTDGAGEAGSAIVGLSQMTFMMDNEQISDTEVERTGLFEGRRASTKERKAVENSTNQSADITFIEKDRFLIQINGNGYSLDELKGVINKLNFSILK